MTDPKLSAMERARRAIEAHPAYDCGSTGDEEMARAAILAYLSALAEDEEFMADAAFNAFAAEWKKGPGPAREAQWREEHLIWLENAKSFLRTLIERAQGDAK